MKAKDIKIGKRVYHEIFGWCKITHPPNPDYTLIDLEADAVEYYVIGKGYVHYERDKKTGENIVYVPISELYQDDKDLPPLAHLHRTALNPTLTYWKHGR